MKNKVKYIIVASVAQSSEQAPLISSESLLRSWFRFSDRGFRSILVADTRDLICEKSQSTLYTESDWFTQGTPLPFLPTGNVDRVAGLGFLRVVLRA